MHLIGCQEQSTLLNLFRLGKVLKWKFKIQKEPSLFLFMSE